MKKNLIKSSFGKRIHTLKLLIFHLVLVSALLLSSYKCDTSVEYDQDENNQNIFLVYPNSGNKITAVDYNTFEVTGEITINIPDSLQIHRMCLSTNNDYLVFCVSSEKAPFLNYIMSYDIKHDSVHNIFPTGLDSVGAPRLTAAYIPDQPGLTYLYSHNVGLYSVDFLSENVSMISSEHGQGLGKYFYFNSNKKLTAILKKWGSENAYSEIELYNTLSGLGKVEFILNANNRDGLQIDDLAFSENDMKIFISIRLQEMRGIANYFGSYDLGTNELYKSPITFPWSLNPYYMAYSPKRREVYMVGAQDKFYVIDTSTNEYQLKTVLDLTGKLPSPSRILIRPDEKVAFVSCVYSNFVLAIDLENRQILKTIEIANPYLMLLL